MIQEQQKIEPILKVVIPGIIIIPIANYYFGISSIFIIISLGFFHFSIKRFLEISVPKKWKETKAVILNKDIVTCKQTDRYGRYTTSIYSPRITYEYVINGKSYTSSQYRVNSKNSWSENIDRVNSDLAKFIVNEDIKIFYNPRSPKNSAIDPNPAPFTRFKAYYLLIIALAIAVLGAQICYLHYS